MSALLRGPHHCAAVGTSTAELIFRHLQTRCEAAGGQLTAADLETARAQFFQGLPGAFPFFEQSNQRCMEASAGTAPAVFATENMLATLLLTCTQKAARTAFQMQVNRFGNTWVNQFFNGFSAYIRAHVCTDADARLRKVYATLSVAKGAKLSVADLMQDETVRKILRESLAPFLRPDAGDKLAIPASDQISQSIAVQRGIPKPDISKVTDQELRGFLTWLPSQVAVAMGAAAAA
jgi:hypothetical protein